MQKVIIFSAPSGSGKTTLVHYALSQIPELEFSVTATTRGIRGEEIHGKDYFFLNEQEFKIKVDRGDFVEYEEVYPGKFYGTLKSEIDRIFGCSKAVIFDVDVKGGISLKKYFGAQALSIFIMPPSLQELERRLQNRNTDSAETIAIRVAKAQEEINYSTSFDKLIVNDDLEKAKSEVLESIRNFLKTH